MRKSILALLIASSYGATMANYIITVPIEINKGGALQNGSISFKNGTSPVVDPETPITPPEPTNECISPVLGSSGWRVQKTTGVVSVLWNGQTVSTGNSAGSTTVPGNNGIVYTQDPSGGLVANGMFNFYGVCRSIPGDFNGGTWVSIAPTVSAWSNSGSVHSCTWTPDSNNYLPSQSVDQIGINCKQTQTRTSQAREQNDSTYAIRNVGSAVVQSQDVDSDENPTRTVAGTDNTTDPETCGYDRIAGWYWMVDNNQVAYVSWKGIQIYDYNLSPALGNVTQLTVNGITYKRLTFQDGDSNISNYSVCRVNI